MHKIDTSSSVATMPTPTAVGTPGWFAHGNPALGVPFTVLSSDWANCIQAEIVNVIAAASITLDKTLQNQLLAAIQALILAHSPFTPVQQGGGANQLTNKIYIGWDLSGKLRLQVDSTDEGEFVLAHDTTHGATVSGNAASNWWRVAPDGYIEQGGFIAVAPGTLNEQVGFNIPFTVACYSTTATIGSDIAPSTTTGNIGIAPYGLISSVATDNLHYFAISNTDPAGASQGVFWRANGY